MKNRQIRFARRPEGEPSADIFDIEAVDVAAPKAGEILCRVRAVSVDPYLRLKMYDRRSYTPPLQIGEQIPGMAVAEVMETCADGLAAGDHVLLNCGWQQYATVPESAAKKIDLDVAPVGAWLGPMGVTGMTAYAGLMHVGAPKSGETLVVSGAAGAVGGLVGQIGRLMGCRVVGIAGSAEKCRVVTEEFGFDACLNYKDPDLAEQLKATCDTGCDIYFDNVGGAISRDVAQCFNDFGRFIACGLISQYSGQQAADPHAFDEFMRIILTRRIKMQGFIVTDIASRYPEFEEKMAAWLKNGEIVHKEYAREGFEEIIPAWLAMLKGENVGKSVVYL
jgi:NADPH-dependent curcumin reductase CurA